MVVRCIVAIILSFVGCASRSEVDRFDRTASACVRLGRYERPVEMMNSRHPLYRRIDRLRHDVEQHENLLRSYVREQLDAKPPLEFHFSYAAFDSTANRLLLRYFAFHPNPTLVAGWQVQLVYQLPRTRLLQVYVEALPLE